MSNSTNLISRGAALLFFVAAAAGIFAFMTRSDLKAMEHRPAVVEEERSTLKTELMATEKTVLSNSTAVQSCTKEMETYNCRAQSAEAALEDMKAPKQSKSPRAPL